MSSMMMPLWKVLAFTNDPYNPDDATPALGSGGTIGLDTYPIFDEQQRGHVNRLILDHYWNREIGQETISMFTFMMRRTMREIMPTYNQLYLSTKYDFDPLSTYDLSTVRDGTATETGTQATTSSTSSTGDASSESVYFDTPQMALSGSKDYATNATKADSSNSNTGSSTGSGNTSTTGTNNDTSKTTGRQGSANRLLAEFRANIINVDLALVEEREIANLFLGVWDTGDEIPWPHRFRAGIL